MGPSDALTRKDSLVQSRASEVPRNNVLFIGVIALLSVPRSQLRLGAEMLNFGALTAFLGVKLAALLHFFPVKKSRKSTLLHLCAGFSFAFRCA
jgi:hypothetical protein